MRQYSNTYYILYCFKGLKAIPILYIIMSSQEATVEYTLRTLKFGDDEEMTEQISIFETVESKATNEYTAYDECDRCGLKFCNQCIFSKNYAVNVCFCEECYIELTEKKE